MDIKAKLKEIIPAVDRDHREGFTNEKLIDNLTYDERLSVEQGLIDMIYESPSDILIVKTLSYMKTHSAIPAFIYALNNNQIPVQRIIIALCIYKLNNDQHMIDVALENFNGMVSSKYDLVLAFDYLVAFHDKGLDEKVRTFTNDPDYIVAYNAKKAFEQ